MAVRVRRPWALSSKRASSRYCACCTRPRPTSSGASSPQLALFALSLTPTPTPTPTPNLNPNPNPNPNQGNINEMYQFSLEYFSALFLDCIRRSEKSAELEQRLANIMKFASYNIFNNVARGIYGEHKITYSFMITTSIMRNAEVISSEP